MPNPWLKLTQEDLQAISGFVPREEIDFYRKQGYMPDRLREDIQEFSDVQLPSPQVQYRKKVDSWKNNFRPRKAKPSSVPKQPAQGVWDGLSKVPIEDFTNTTPSAPQPITSYADFTKETGPAVEGGILRQEELDPFAGVENVDSINPDDFRAKINKQMDTLKLPDEDRATYWQIVNENPQMTNIEKMSTLKELLKINMEQK